MFHIVLFEPEIPPNTGNIIRLCANCGSALHIIKPAGFTLDDSKLRRAGLDYHEFASVREWDGLDEFMREVQPVRLYACSTKGKQRYTDVAFAPGDAFLFGPESRGLPATVLSSVPQNQMLRVPMRANNRSLNLSNAVAVIVYEAWRQNDFGGAD